MLVLFETQGISTGPWHCTYAAAAAAAAATTTILLLIYAVNQKCCPMSPILTRDEHSAKARYCYSKSFFRLSVCPSVYDVGDLWS